MEALFVLGIAGILVTLVGATVNTTDNIWNTIGQVVLFLTYLVGQYVAWKQAGRQRQWQIEDRDQLAKTTKDTAKTLAISTGAALKEQTKDVVTQVQEIADKQTRELTEAQRTRITDLGLAFDNILKDEDQRRRKDDRS